MFEFALTLFKALAAIPSIINLVRDFAAGVVFWWVQSQNGETQREISDVAAFAARATNEKERYEAAQKWRSALSRPRVSG